MSPVQFRIESLVKLLNKWIASYAKDNNPIASDDEFDSAMRELRILEERHPELIHQDSPSHAVGHPVSGNGVISRTLPMLSLDGVYTLEQLKIFLDKTASDINSSFLVEPKIDGLAIELVYVNGLLIKATTRGDGYAGEDVTVTALKVVNIPEISSAGNVTIRGEVYLPKSEFKRVNEERFNLELEPFVNCRNAAAGSMRQKDSNVTASRGLMFFPYSILQGGIEVPLSPNGVKTLGYTSDENRCILKSFNELTKYKNNMEAKRESLPYDIDGIVVKRYDPVHVTSLGTSKTVPKWALAFKFQSSCGETILTDVIYQVSKSGTVTAVGILEPITIEGSTFSRVSLYNKVRMEAFNLKLGCKVLIQRAKDVIPELIYVVPDTGTTELKYTTKCPSCNGELIADKSVVKCTNTRCRSIAISNLIHFGSRKAMNIDGLGNVSAELLYDVLKVDTPAKLYSLTVDDLLTLDGFSKGKANKLFIAISESKSNELYKLIYALGIPSIGLQSAKALACYCGSLMDILTVDKANLVLLKEIGVSAMDNLIDFCTSRKEDIVLLNTLVSVL